MWCLVSMCLVIMIIPCQINSVSGKTEIKKVKRILFWTKYSHQTIFGSKNGHINFFTNKGCSYTNCKIFTNRYYHSLEVYDAIVFHAYDRMSTTFETPHARSQKQLYVFMTLEPAIYFNIPPRLTNFFNMTMTYRLDSNIVWPFFAVVDRNSNIDVAPVVNPPWIATLPKVDEKANKESSDVKKIVAAKEIEVAWIEQNCDRVAEMYVEKVRSNGITVDSYGLCGLSPNCSVHENCIKGIGARYYFLFIFEKALCVDYLSESVVDALENGVVPIIFSGANLKNFLPPNSYIDGSKLSPKDVAGVVRQYMGNKEDYERFFWWRKQYRVERRYFEEKWATGKHPLCNLCDILHHPLAPRSLRKKEVRFWWQTKPNSKEFACSQPFFRFLPM